MKKYLLILMVLIFSANLSHTAVPDSCLTLAFPHAPEEWLSNPDSVHIDTCMHSPTYMKIYAYKYFILKFEQYYYPFDEVLFENEIRTVEDISDSKPELKTKFQELQDIFGTLYFQGIEGDTVGTLEERILYRARFQVFFEDYQHADDVISVFENEIDSLKYCHLRNVPKIGISVHDKPQSKSSLIIYPNPADSYIEIISKDGAEIEKVEIYSLFGEKLCEYANDRRIDVSNLAQGTYYIRINNSFQIFAIVR